MSFYLIYYLFSPILVLKGGIILSKKTAADKYKAAELTTEIIKDFYRETKISRSEDTGKVIANNFEEIYSKILELLISED